ncbi:unnamed protein product [Ceutorhynchus assimilis]|uniref:Uncharacterized protein n=1 Tax=Ceutorhynchus assimilis TaxID=467358 RepID=A0A9N9QNJ6_9CUCU|nr:unnamed protein product [Ceutorhynchus assimilis]
MSSVDYKVMYNKMKNVTSRTQKIMDFVRSEHEKDEGSMNQNGNTLAKDRGDIEICETSLQTPNITDAISDIDGPQETLSFAESQNVSTTESKSTTDENVNDDQALSSTKIAAEYPVDNDPITEPGSESDHGASSSDNYDPENESSSSSSSCSTCSSSSSSSEDSSQETSKLPLKRKKKNIGTWKKNIRKQKRLRGEAYISVKNIEKPARPLLPPPCAAKPKHKCLQSVSEENRSKIYVEFRRLSALDDQRSFIIHHVEQIPKKRITRNLENSRRENTCNYFLTVDGQKMKVCREFFMSTLKVTDSFIRISLQKRSSTGIVEKDRRGKHTPANKLTDDCLQIIRDHILTFPAVESHYCRSSSKKKYLDPTLNLSIMHNMYKSLCEEKNIPPVSLEKYRQVFKEYNVGFFKPKKDQCKICLAQKNMTGEEKEAQEETFQQHLKRKESARKTRNEDKLEAKDNSTLIAFNFDLEAVLTTPKGAAGQIFYLRKLAVYNLTIYNIGNQDGICYLWDETQGKRGSNEIASCIYEYVLSNTEIKKGRMMSDGCGSQQKNSNFAAMCMYLISVHPSLKIIDHKFFETGNTEMECDSIHSKIEQKAKHVPVYIPEGWAQGIRDARMKPRPFEVKSRSFDDFYDFKEYTAQNFDMSKIPWRKICWIRYLKSDKTEVFYKIGFDQEFQEVNCKKKFRGRPKTVELKKAYECELPIAKPKYLDLQKMCSDLTIEEFGAKSGQRPNLSKSRFRQILH